MLKQRNLATHALREKPGYKSPDYTPSAPSYSARDTSIHQDTFNEDEIPDFIPDLPPGNDEAERNREIPRTLAIQDMIRQSDDILIKQTSCAITNYARCFKDYGAI